MAGTAGKQPSFGEELKPSSSLIHCHLGIHEEGLPEKNPALVIGYGGYGDLLEQQEHKSRPVQKRLPVAAVASGMKFGLHFRVSVRGLHMDSPSGELLNAIGEMMKGMENRLQSKITGVEKRLESMEMRLGKVENSLGHRTEREVQKEAEKHFGEVYAKAYNAQCLVDLAALIPVDHLPEEDNIHLKIVAGGMLAAQKLVDDGVPLLFLKHLYTYSQRAAAEKAEKMISTGGDSEESLKAIMSSIGGDSECPRTEAEAAEEVVEDSTVLDINSWKHLRENHALFTKVKSYLESADEFSLPLFYLFLLTEILFFADKVDTLARCRSFGIAAMLFSINPKFIFKENGQMTIFDEVEFDVRGRITLFLKNEGGAKALVGAIEAGECKSNLDYGLALRQLAVRLEALHWMVRVVAEREPGLETGHIAKIGHLFLLAISQLKEAEEREMRNNASAALWALGMHNFSLHVHCV